jgi:signal transduction histidine kinase/FixJ family two-component response regulator
MDEQGLFQNVLLVEDDASHAVLIKRALRNAVGSVQHYSRLEEAYANMTSAPYDLIITDLNLPDSLGVKHVAELKTRSGGLPLLVLTSSNDLQVAIEAMKRGADEFIVKNFDNNFPEVMYLSLSRLFTSRTLEAEKIRIQKEIEVLRLAIENSSDAMAVGDFDGKVIYSNRAFLSFVNTCGGKSSDLKEIFSSKVNKCEGVSSSMLKNLGELSPGGVWQSEVTLADNKELSFEINLSVIGDEKAKRESWKNVFWVKDISEEKRREKFQREILSTTTHDLKGPLGAILLSCELLENMLPKEEKPAQLVLRIDSSARGAVNLIDEFLSARRIQEGTFILKPVSHDIVSLIQDVLGENKNIALARGLNLQFNPPAGGVEAKVDKLALTRVLGNLLSNAFKFTPKGGDVIVGCQNAGDYYHVSVSDTGSGMEPSEVKKIFERFSRLDKHREISGTGIGLFIVKSLVAAHGGEIQVTSNIGKGSNFDISLPKNPPVNERGELISLDFG